MILEVNPDSLRDIAAAVASARKRVPDAAVLEDVEKAVLSALRGRLGHLDLTAEAAQALRNALLQRAWDQRKNSEGNDYADLADRIESALDDSGMPEPDLVQDPQRP